MSDLNSLTIAEARDAMRAGKLSSVELTDACLTAIETGPGWFAVEISAETLRSAIRSACACSSLACTRNSSAMAGDSRPRAVK